MYNFHAEVVKDFPGGLPLRNLSDDEVKNFLKEQKARFAVAVSLDFYVSDDPAAPAVKAAPMVIEPEPAEPTAEIQPEPVVLKHVEEVAPVQEAVAVEAAPKSKK